MPQVKYVTLQHLDHFSRKIQMWVAKNQPNLQKWEDQSSTPLSSGLMLAVPQISSNSCWMVQCSDSHLSYISKCLNHLCSSVSCDAVCCRFTIGMTLAAPNNYNANNKYHSRNSSNKPIRDTCEDHLGSVSQLWCLSKLQNTKIISNIIRNYIISVKRHKHYFHSPPYQSWNKLQKLTEAV